MKTRIIEVDRAQLGHFAESDGREKLESWEIPSETTVSVSALKQAAEYLRLKDIPVAFPTETVYGLGADATRIQAVKGIYAVKGRPSDNPLIVHVCDLAMLRSLLRLDQQTNGYHDPIPQIYKPLIERFWPGPLTILLPNPQHSRLAPEVTAGLPSFGARMPACSLALSLIKLAGTPLAAPSANASTKPSPTTAQHVLDDLDGRIELILDGGPCNVGVESTVVDGLCSPPVILRPGGVSLDELRSCPGWEDVVQGYKDHSEVGKAAPRAPGMKYKHYSPKARVILYESTNAEGLNGIARADVQTILSKENGSASTKECAMHIKRIGVIRTRRWKAAGGLRCSRLQSEQTIPSDDGISQDEPLCYEIHEGDLLDEGGATVGKVIDIDLGQDIRRIAQGLFSALRELDRRGADMILVDGIEDKVDIAAAVMNRLRKAASVIRT